MKGLKADVFIETARATLIGRCDCAIARDRAEGLRYRAQDHRPAIRFQPTDHTGNNSYCAALLAALAYKTQAEIERELVEYGYTDWNVWFLATPLASAFVTEWDATIVVAFKGSSTIREWLNNLNVRLKRTAYGGVHTGFYNSIMQIGPELLTILRPSLLSGSKVTVTGHSRGGALAILFAFLMALNGFRADGIYTFGSPKTGDAEFSNNWRGEFRAYPIKTRWLPSWIVTQITIVSSVSVVFGKTFLVPIGFRIKRSFRRMCKRDRNKDIGPLGYTPIRDHFISSYVVSLRESMKTWTIICAIYSDIIARNISWDRLLDEHALKKEYATMTLIREGVVADPEAIEGFCGRHGLLSESVQAWIGDYRVFTLTREISRRELFFKEVDLIARDASQKPVTRG